ncbi:MAG: hypothetical protein BWY15_01016 [Firmicutes bacterium ADurb.Bin193]|nr:MAG: hypothetical protein BWY15_01016 [Firmicutes bacterium ADurb.Bin193]
MLSNEEFVRHSIDLNLFFMRIMKEHMFFIQVAFTPKDQNLGRQADMLKAEATRILAETISVANGLLSPQVAASGEIVTNYTLEAEKATQFFTGIAFDIGLTQAEQGLSAANRVMINPMVLQRVRQINQKAINLLKSIISFKEKILNSVLTCEIFTLNYPLLIDHVLREARFYLNMINRLQNREDIDSEKDLAEQEAFWNRIMAEHAKFIRGLLDPTEVDLFNAADMFGDTFDMLTQESLEAQRHTELLSDVTDKSIKATTEIRNFKRQGTEGILECKIKSIIIPLLGDHTLREANHFLRILKTD